MLKNLDATPIHSAMDYFAPTANMWGDGVASYEAQKAQHTDEMIGRRAGLLAAVRLVEQQSLDTSQPLEAPVREAVDRYWATYWTKVKEYGDEIPQEGEVIHGGKYRESYVSLSEYEGKEAVTKHAEAAVLRPEVSVLSAVDGAGAPKLYAYTESENGEAVLTMERIKGESLSSRINLDRKWRSTPLSEDDSKSISLGLIDALQKISNAGYLYRDMNLDHVIIEDGDAEGISVKLLDLESSLLKDEQGRAVMHDQRGTWETMAPEEFKEEGVMTEASLVYMVGTVLSQLLLGKNQFFVDIPDIDDNSLRKMAEYVHTAYPDPYIEGSLGTVVREALQPLPENRPQSLQELRSMLVGE